MLREREEGSKGGERKRQRRRRERDRRRKRRRDCKGEVRSEGRWTVRADVAGRRDVAMQNRRSYDTDAALCSIVFIRLLCT